MAAKKVPFTAKPSAADKFVSGNLAAETPPIEAQEETIVQTPQTETEKTKRKRISFLSIGADLQICLE